jgi:hypothetical protein
MIRPAGVTIPLKDSSHELFTGRFADINDLSAITDIQSAFSGGLR